MVKAGLELVKNKIAVVSGKGGTGKSAFSAMLALSLAGKGKKVGLLDLDLHGPNIPLMLGIEGKKLSAGKKGKLLPVRAKPNLLVFSTSFMLGPKQALVWRGPLKSNLIRQAVEQIDWGRLDFLIVDNPPGTGDEIITLVQSMKLDGAILVATPQKAAVYDASKAVNMLKKANVRVLGAVENMSYALCPHCGKKMDFFGEGSIKKLAREEKFDFFGKMPLDTALREMADKGKIQLRALAPETRKTLATAGKKIGKINK